MNKPAGLARKTLRDLLRFLVDGPFLGLLFITLIGILALAQVPFHYSISIGQEDGFGADLPFVNDWHTTEAGDGTRFRWTAETSHVQFAGLPPAPSILSLHVLGAGESPHIGSGVTRGGVSPTAVVAWPVRKEPRWVHMMIPADEITSGQLDFIVSAPTWTPRNDRRTLGVPAGMLNITSVPSSRAGPSAADLLQVPRVLFWPIMLLPILYLPLRSWAPRRHVALLLAAIICGLCLVWMMVDRPRYALAGPAATNAFLWSIVLASSLRLAISKVSHRLPVVPSRRLLNTFVLIFFVLFGLRYMGRLYPSSMLGDIGFHINRQHNVIQGTILLLSRHRAIDFPYPSAVYVLLLPLRLLPIEASSLVNWSDALFGALGLFPLGYLMLYAWRSELAATFAALVYALLAPAMMSLWWSFLPHIFAQELAVLLLVGMIVGWQRLGTGRGWAIGSLGLSILFLSHFGFYINISVLFGFFLLLVFALRKRAWASRAFAVNIRSVMLIFATAQIIAFGLFYSAFLGLFTDKLLVFSRGGMSAVQGGRGTTPASVLWNLIWTNGLGVHYATIGVPIAALGAYLLLCGPADPILKMIFIATGVTTLVQGAIPFLTASTITTRWLSFATWIVAVGVAVFLEALWRRGPIGRLAGVLCLSWLLFNTLRIWANATGYRITPPEPF